MTVFDHLFFVVVLVAVPLYLWRSFPSWVADVDERGEPARIAGYRETIVIWSLAALALLVLWATTGREWSELGLRPPESPRFVLGAALGAVIVGLVWWQLDAYVSKVLGGRVSREQLRRQLGTTETLFPDTKRELAWFRALSVNAGVSEELIFRGFLLWYLEPLVGLAGAGALSIALFALGHGYQGWKRLPGIAAMGGLFVALYFVSGSIWLPILVHAAVDAVQGNLLGAQLRARRLALQGR